MRFTTTACLTILCFGLQAYARPVNIARGQDNDFESRNSQLAARSLHANDYALYLRRASDVPLARQLTRRGDEPKGIIHTAEGIIHIPRPIYPIGYVSNTDTQAAIHVPRPPNWSITDAGHASSSPPQTPQRPDSTSSTKADTGHDAPVKLLHVPAGKHPLVKPKGARVRPGSLPVTVPGAARPETNRRQTPPAPAPAGGSGKGNKHTLFVANPDR